MKLSLVVPCFNEQDNVKPFLSACKDAFSDKEYDYELIFINDGSSDSTWKSLKALYDSESRDNYIKLVNFSRNFARNPLYMPDFSTPQATISVLLMLIYSKILIWSPIWWNILIPTLNAML